MLLNAFELTTSFLTTTEESLEQLLKEPSETTFTLYGILMLSRPVHPLNAYLPIKVSVSGRVIDVIFVHP